MAAPLTAPAERRYSVREAARLLDLPPSTLRAWERRYGLPTPERSSNGYRRYSDLDLLTLRWLKEQSNSGLGIGRAAQLLAELRMSGRDPATEAGTGTLMGWPLSLAHLQAQWLVAIEAMNDTAATSVLRLASSLYPMQQVLLDLISPALQRLGDRWQNGDLPVAIEHFASQLSLRHLMSLLVGAPEPYRRGVLLAACAPGEQHQIGLLMLVLLLRCRGWVVKYLGPDLTLESLDQVLVSIRPDLVLFSAARPETASGLLALADALHRLPPPRPQVVVGGQAFHVLALQPSLPGTIVTGTAREAVGTIEAILSEKNDPYPNEDPRPLWRPRRKSQ